MNKYTITVINKTDGWNGRQTTVYESDCYGTDGRGAFFYIRDLTKKGLVHYLPTHDIINIKIQNNTKNE